MIFEKVYENLMSARKNQNKADREIYSLVYGAFKNKAIELKIEVLADAECLAIIKKTIKQLEEEIELYTKANKLEKVEELKYQKTLLEGLLPQQLSEDKIKEIIASLEDKTMPSIMKHFKTNYNGQVDMGLVNKLVRNQ